MEMLKTGGNVILTVFGGQPAMWRLSLSGIGVLVPVIAPHDSVPDGAVQAILIASPSGHLTTHCVPGLWLRFPQFARADLAVHAVRQEPALVVHKEKDA
jgi:hypothetical protein